MRPGHTAVQHARQPPAWVKHIIQKEALFMDIRTCYLTQNDCYRAGRTITPKGIMVHSTATPGEIGRAHV